LEIEECREPQKGHTPAITCINHASADLGVDFDDLIAALQVFVNEVVRSIRIPLHLRSY